MSERKLPKLRPCPYCGKEPEFYNGWYDATRATAGLTVFCKCDRLYITPYPYSLDDVVNDEALVDRVINDVAKRWNDFCDKATGGRT